MKTYVILSAGKSSTSLVAEGIYRAGVKGYNLYYGGLRKAHPKGMWEDKDFFTMNRRILRHAGGDWDDPPSEKSILKVGKKFNHKIKRLMDKRNALGVSWGWKDPRTALTVKCYLPYIINPHFIAVFRKPLEVAKSMEKVNKIPIEKGIELTLEYNRRIRSFLEEWERS